MKKITALIMIIAYCLFAFTACSFITFDGGADGTGSDETTTVPAVIPEGLERVEYDLETPKAQAKERVSSLADYDFEKDTFSAAVVPGISFAPDDALDGYDDALVYRNQIVEEKYGISIGEFETPLELMLSDSYSAYLAGLYYSDIMIIPQSALGSFAEKGYLLNVYSIPYINYDKEYFYGADMAQAAAGYNSYAVIGDLTDDPTYYYCVYVNDALAQKLGAEIPYSSVEDGTWTWSKLIECARACADPDNGIRVIGAGSASELVCAVYKSSGSYFMNTGLGVTPTVGFNNESAQKTVDILRSLQRDDLLIFDNYNFKGSAEADFAAGRTLFYTDTVGNLNKADPLGSAWRVMPIPKLNDQQEDYCAYLSPDAPVVVTDAGNTYPEDTAYALDALFAASGEYLKIAYTDRVIRVAANGSETLDILDYVYGVKAGRAVYDFCDMFGGSYPALRTNTSEALWSLVVSDGTLSDTARSSSSALSWTMNNAFPVLKN